MFYRLLVFFFFFSTVAVADNANTLNLYLWASEIPDSVIQAFEKETHIVVNYATYDSNEVLYAKFLAAKNPGYDIIQPSSYFITRMRQQGMLMPIDKQRIPNLKYLDPQMMDPRYDPQRQYSIPGLWGVTGIFVNKKFYDPDAIKTWSDLWSPKYHNALLLIDDLREVFSMALLSLSLSPNAESQSAIQAAFVHLQALMPNIKLFAGEAIPSIIADEDATIGMAWNGDAFDASESNPNIVFIYPQDGFVAWADDFAIPKAAPHLKNAYLFLNFIERPDINAKIIEEEGYPTANIAAKRYLPQDMRESSILFPPENVMKRAIWQTDINDQALAWYQTAWTRLKLSA